MSRIGRKPIAIPKGVQVGIQGQQVEVKGPKGRLELRVHELCSVRIADGSVVVARGAEHRSARALHGLTRALVANMVHGVTEGFERKLEIQGIGYRVQMTGRNLTFALGYSHSIVYALLRALRPPDSYKGKGVGYAGEVVRKKVGKTGAK